MEQPQQPNPKQKLIDDLFAGKITPANKTVGYLLNKAKALKGEQARLVQEAQQMEQMLAQARHKITATGGQLQGYAEDLVYWQLGIDVEVIPPEQPESESDS